MSNIIWARHQHRLVAVCYLSCLGDGETQPELFTVRERRDEDTRTVKRKTSYCDDRCKNQEKHTQTEGPRDEVIR